MAPTELPLALAARKVVASMQAVLKKTYESFVVEKRRIEKERRNEHVHDEETEKNAEKKMYFQLTKAVELKLVRNVRDLIDAPDVEHIKVEEVVLHKL